MSLNSRLTDNSFKVVQTLEDTKELQDSILEAQRKSLAQQEHLLESSSQLGLALDMSKDNVKDMLEEFRFSLHFIVFFYIYQILPILLFFLGLQPVNKEILFSKYLIVFRSCKISF